MDYSLLFAVENNLEKAELNSVGGGNEVFRKSDLGTGDNSRILSGQTKVKPHIY